MVNGPAFSATKITTAQTISNGVATKVTFNSEDFDTDNCFASSTFTPTVAGYYIVTACASISYSDNTGITNAVSIYKNGSQYTAAGNSLSSGTTAFFRPTVSAVIYMNGTTDYLEVYATGASSTATITVAAATATRFSACMLRGA
jgi:hypothetical protein